MTPAPVCNQQLYCQASEHVPTCRVAWYRGAPRPRRRILDLEAHEYHGVWRLWKAVSLCLFGLFVVVLWDMSRTLRALSVRPR